MWRRGEPDVLIEPGSCGYGAGIPAPVPTSEPEAAAATAAVRELIDRDRLRAEPQLIDGYLDLIGNADPTGTHPGQRLMESSGLARIYERLWRPLWSRVLLGAIGPGMRGEQELAERMLDLSPGDCVLDVGCGPGSFTRRFAEAVDPGFAFGLDASKPMLTRAVAVGVRPNLAYVRADAAALPFRDRSFEAICCFAALHLIERPWAALDEMARVLAPGGRLALLASLNRGPVPTRAVDLASRALSGVRIFGPGELTVALRERGLERVEQRPSGLAQFVFARRPSS
jgi:SAM-dependent methyltransferase